MHTFGQRFSCGKQACTLYSIPVIPSVAIGHGSKQGLWHELMVPRVLHFSAFMIHEVVYLERFFWYEGCLKAKIYICIFSVRFVRGIVHWEDNYIRT